MPPPVFADPRKNKTSARADRDPRERPCLYPRQCSWLADLTVFPDGNHDDQADSTAHRGQMQQAWDLIALVMACGFRYAVNVRWGSYSARSSAFGDARVYKTIALRGFPAHRSLSTR